MGLKYLSKTVSGANTATALASTNTPCCAILIQIDKDCVAPVYFGDSTVHAGNDIGIILSNTDGDAYAATQFVDAHGAPNAIDLSQIYISSVNAGGAVKVIYFEV